MVVVRELIEQVARYLSDYDDAGDPDFQYRTWSEKDLRYYFTLAIGALVSNDPKLFSAPVVVNIPKSGLVQLPSECEECLGTLQYISPTGKVTNQPPYTDKNPYTIARPPCAGTPSKEVVPSVVRAAFDRRVLLATPQDVGGSLVLSCSNTPVITTNTATVDIPAKYASVLFNLMVSYAYGTDTESAVMRERSNVHWERAGALLAIPTDKKGK
jgi:hypothetical protein